MAFQKTSHADAEVVAVATIARPEKIVVVLSGLTAGGSERVTSLLVNHWAEQGRSVTVVSFDSVTDVPFFEMDPRVEICQLGLPGSPRKKPLLQASQMARRVLALRNLIRAKSPDLVFSFLTKINVLTLLATRGLRIPVVVSERNNPLMQPMNPLWSRFRDALYPSAFRLIAQTEDVARHLPYAMQTKSVVIPNPIVPEAVEDAQQPRVVAAVGRFVEQKGFDLLLRAIACVKPQSSDWKFVIWGDGDERKRLESLCGELGLRDQVTFPGLSTSPREWLSKTSIFVLSSRYEGFPNALGEAMAAGLPVISFDCPFGPSALIKTGVDGLLVTPENVEAMAFAITRLMNDEDLRRRLGHEARISVRRFAPEQVLKKWDDVADAALRQKQKATRAAVEKVSVYEPDRT